MNLRFAAAPLALIALALAGGCGGADRPAPDARPWRAFVRDLADTGRLASLDVGGTRLISSFDPTGANDDFNNFKGQGTESGWVVLADLKGPGVVRRFWTTGADPGHPFRIYIDGEKKPRLSGTIEELFGDRAPFTPPLARYLNLCWYSYVPLTYQKSIRIETLAPPKHPFWGPRRLFFQINAETLAAGAAVESFPRHLSDEDRAAVAEVQAAWSASLDWPKAEWKDEPVVVIPAGGTGVVFQSDRPGLLRSWTLDAQPAEPADWSQRDKEYLLQDAVLRVAYDGAETSSIEAPLGDFFGNAWRRRYYGSLLVGSGPDGYRCNLPMPFAKGIRMTLANGADRPIAVRFRGDVDALTIANPGYLHAEWRRSGPASGAPHLVADFAGSGRFVGCFLGVTGQGVTQQDNSWWLLEGDEEIFVDGENRPSWHGTGLEDYFNGGWYYRGCAFAALHGIFDRSPFRVAQYRHHLVDPVAFNASLRMTIERGDRNVSHGWFQSTAFAYLAAPRAVFPCPASRDDRRAVEDRYSRQTTMLQLIELERMNNFRKASDLLVEYRERYPEADENGVYALRMLEYRRLLGEPVADDEYAPFIEGRHGASTAEQAKSLQWMHGGGNRVLVGMNANGQARLFMNGQEILAGDQPYGLFVAGIELPPGPQKLAAQVEWRRQDAWFMAGILTASGFTGTGPGSVGIRSAPAEWRTGPIADTWQTMDTRDSARGVPDAPFIGGAPNAYVLLQAKAYPIGVADWGYHRGTAYYRMDFTTPLDGWPAFSQKMTGLAR